MKLWFARTFCALLLTFCSSPSFSEDINPENHPGGQCQSAGRGDKDVNCPNGQDVFTGKYTYEKTNSYIQYSAWMSCTGDPPSDSECTDEASFSSYVHYSPKNPDTGCWMGQRNKCTSTAVFEWKCQ